jgi:putative toxin-antitoxin system antitoxin component (TIGR02293 family)
MFETTHGRTVAMTVQPHGHTPEAGEAELQRVADLLGGSRVLRHRVDDPLDAHEMLLQGIPGAALVHLVEHLANLPMSAAFERAVGMSLRTIQRRKEEPAKPLSQEQSGRTWKFAEVLAKATAVLGSQEEAEAWLQRPAMGLDQRRPIDLLATPAGVEIVQAFLGRLEHGVYT